MMMERFIYLMTCHVFHMSVCFIAPGMEARGDQGFSSVLLTDISPALNKNLGHGRISINICQIRDFLGGPVVKTSCCQYRGHRFDPGSEN